MRGRRLDAGADAHRARRRRGSRARARRRRRRLPRQAVRRSTSSPRGCGRWRGAARSSGRRCWPRATCATTRPRARWRGETESRALDDRARAARGVPAPPRPDPRPRSAARRRPGTRATSAAPTSSTSTCATCARRSTGRSASTSIETIRGTGYRLRADGGRPAESTAALAQGPAARAGDARLRRRSARSCSLALGLFLHARLRAELDASLQAGLRQRARRPDDPGRPGRCRRPGAQRPRRPRRRRRPGPRRRTGGVVAGAPGFEASAAADPAQSSGARAGRALASTRGDAPTTRAGSRCSPRRPDRPGRRGRRVRWRIATTRLGSLDALLLLGLPDRAPARRRRRLRGRRRRRCARSSGCAPAPRRSAAATSAERLPVPAADDEVRRLAETLNGMLARLEEAFARERAFVADASHELRTPLARLKAELELAGRGGRSVAELEEAVRSAAVETDRLVLLAEDLLVLARADQGTLPLRAERLDVARAARRDAAALRPRRHGRGPRRARRRAATGCGSSRRSPTSSTTRGATAAATSRSAPRSTRAASRLHVRDEGAGVPAGAAGAGPSSASPAATRAATRTAAPGSVWRSSRPSPRPTAARAGIADGATVRRLDEAPGMSTAGLCEDDDELREVVKRALEADGLTVTATASGERGRRGCSASGPLDVLILDVGLPGCRRARRLRGAARARRRHAGAVPHRARRAARPAQRLPRRRRRLPDQAVRARRAARPRPGAAAPPAAGRAPPRG